MENISKRSYRNGIQRMLPKQGRHGLLGALRNSMQRSLDFLISGNWFKTRLEHESGSFQKGSAIRKPHLRGSIPFLRICIAISSVTQSLPLPLWMKFLKITLLRFLQYLSDCQIENHYQTVRLFASNNLIGIIIKAPNLFQLISENDKAIPGRIGFASPAILLKCYRFSSFLS